MEKLFTDAEKEMAPTGRVNKINNSLQWFYTLRIRDFRKFRHCLSDRGSRTHQTVTTSRVGQFRVLRIR